MTDRSTHLTTDIAELRELLDTSPAILKSPRNKQHLVQYLGQLEQELAGLKLKEEKATASPQAKPADGEELKGEDETEEPKSVLASVAVSPPAPGIEYVPIVKFGWDQGEYNSDVVNIYLRGEEMQGVGKIKDRVTCDFTTQSFDLKILGHRGKNYRLVKTNLDKDIVPEASKVRVKKDNIKIILRKAKGQYGPEHWTDLVAKRRRTEKTKDDPMGGIMDMMKDMYDNGDDQMKKTIGEAMLKSRSGQPNDPLGDDPMSNMPSFNEGLGDF